MTLATFEVLLSPNGKAALAIAAEFAPTESTFLSCLTRLQKKFDAELSKAALETLILRQKARAKFTRAEQMYFTREALEQASGETVSRYRAQRFAEFATIGDWGCGAGGDSIALAAKHNVFAADLDALRLAMAEQNLAAYGVHANAQFLLADIMQLTLPGLDALFFDPGRRVEGRRKFSVEDYEPRLSLIKTWLPQLQALAVKISPAVALREIANYDCEVEFISVAGELKECVLWFGACKTATPRATLLPGGQTLTQQEEVSRCSAPRAYLYEPDPAILRAGLVKTLAAQLDAYQIDEDIAYLTSAQLVATPFARAFALTEVLPFNLKKLRERLRALQVGCVTIKKRGSPLEPEALVRQLKLSGTEHGVVFLTHVLGKPFVLLGKEIKAG
ncbi:MAG: class I SAM-dependent methyltransferase [candidate division KSB1 bacterium]